MKPHDRLWYSWGMEIFSLCWRLLIWIAESFLAVFVYTVPFATILFFLPCLAFYLYAKHRSAQ